MPKFNPRDKSRTEVGTHQKRIKKHTAPPEGLEAGWMWLSTELLLSKVFRSLSHNAMRVFFRVWCTHQQAGRTENGLLVVTHDQFQEYGASQNLIADAIDECVFKGLLKVNRGIGGDGRSHPNIFTLTMVGTHNGVAPTNCWKRCSADRVDAWKQVRSDLRQKRSFDDNRRSPHNSKRIPKDGQNKISGSQITESDQSQHSESDQNRRIA